MVTGIQIIGMFFACSMFYLTFLHNKRKEFTAKEFGFWTLVWGGLFGISIYPVVLDTFIHDILQFSRRLDFFIIVGFFVLFGLMFYMYTIIRKLQKKIEVVVRAHAIKKPYKK